MKQYVDLLQDILQNGEKRIDRTNVGTLSIFGGQQTFDLRERFPLVTVKKTLWKSAFIEMLWFLRGEDNTDYLKVHDVPIWDKWADDDGKLGPVYGVQWRHWLKYTLVPSLDHTDHFDGSTTYHNAKVMVSKIDQVKGLIDRIKANPQDRRLIVSAWNVADLPDMALPPCHRDFQCYVSNDGQLDLMMNIRSWDTGLGNPFNTAQYAFLTHLIARATNLRPRFLKINYGDAHIYLDQVPLISDWLSKYSPINCDTHLVYKTINVDIDKYSIDDFDVVNYESNPFLKLPIAV